MNDAQLPNFAANVYMRVRATIAKREILRFAAFFVGVPPAPGEAAATRARRPGQRRSPPPAPKRHPAIHVSVTQQYVSVTQRRVSVSPAHSPRRPAICHRHPATCQRQFCSLYTSPSNMSSSPSDVSASALLTLHVAPEAHAPRPPPAWSPPPPPPPPVPHAGGSGGTQ